jgi:hypothetical protein
MLKNKANLMKLRNSAKILTVAIVIFLGIFFYASTGCKSPEDPDVEISANVTVSNECGLALDIYLNGVFQFSLEFLFYDVINNLQVGVYEITAKIKDTQEVLQSYTVDVFAKEEIWLSILYSASINVVNEYGEPLNIFTNGSNQGELGDKQNQVFTQVPYGDHVLEASKTSDNTLVASVTINVVEEKEYTWTIR